MVMLKLKLIHKGPSRQVQFVSLRQRSIFFGIIQVHDSPFFLGDLWGLFFLSIYRFFHLNPRIAYMNRNDSGFLMY